LSEAKQYLRVLSDEEDDIIELHIQGALEWASGFTKTILPLTACVSVFSFTPGSVLEIENQKSEITKVIQDGTETTDYTITCEGDFILLTLNSLVASDVTVEYSAGFTQVPSDIKMAYLLKIGSFYDKREEVSKRYRSSAEDLLLPYCNYNI
jgi:hypothetical protein